MFERFDKAARQAVQTAVRKADAQLVDTRHLLQALAVDPGSRAGKALADLGVDEAALRDVLAAMDRADRRAGLSPADVDALASIGIDVDEVVGAIERNWGGRLPASRRGQAGLIRGRFGAEAKKVLELALREAVERGDRRIDDGHVLLGLLKFHDPVAQELADRGVTYLRVRTALARQ
ncbi:Clp protease N-terminal domain-containing protein [Fodinicola acaciae]|uniref:Clp protease N-terminal domain-containing protein n=1 Tax=Fodinicola acaciae TaxID=2681555 RepID=UPI0013D3F871|nr:Clp protease N-terminal domain-containing protein [Fodinicola acaciae]